MYILLSSYALLSYLFGFIYILFCIRKNWLEKNIKPYKSFIKLVTESVGKIQVRQFAFLHCIFVYNNKNLLYIIEICASASHISSAYLAFPNTPFDRDSLQVSTSDRCRNSPVNSYNWRGSNPHFTSRCRLLWDQNSLIFPESSSLSLPA